MRRLSAVICVVVLLLCLGLPPHNASAQGQQCFPTTGFCITGRFLQYWEQNGGLSVFGYPTSEAFFDTNEAGERYLVQWFERNVFELHPENRPPYDVLLGRLGDETLLFLDYDWQAQPRDAGPKPGCIWFSETQFNVCNAAGATGFKTYWETHGLEFDGTSGKSYQESLALFGLPLTSPYVEENSSGDTVLMQWFERARFEWHPNNPEPQQVLLGLLGNEYISLIPEPEAEPEPEPEPTPQPTAAPPDLCANIPAPRFARAEPNCVKANTTFIVEVWGFEPNERIGFWITRAGYGTIGSTQGITVDENGRFRGSVNTRDWFGVVIPPGDYVFVAQELAQIYEPSIAPFRVIP